MKLSLRNNVVGLFAETPEERAICALLSAADGHISHLHAAMDVAWRSVQSARKIMLAARPSTLSLHSDELCAKLKSPTHAFHTRWRTLTSIESFWQGLETADTAKKMRKACEAKFTLNSEAREALLATGEGWLTHKVCRDSRTIPGAIMADMWIRIRAKLQDKEASLKCLV